MTQALSINIQGKEYTFDQPKIMGIINLSPDSFYDGGENSTIDIILKKINQMIGDGADMIDIGAMSSRPYSQELPVEEELRRVKNALPEIMKEFPNTIFSIDTYRSPVAEYALTNGVSIINDITAGLKDPSIINLAKDYDAPFIAMHMQGMPDEMQVDPQYKHILDEVFDFLKNRIEDIQSKGVKDVIIDVGFGFGKSIEDNFTLLKHQSKFLQLGCPILIGISRKSMIYKSLDISPSQALNGTTALHFEALRQGAHILRVHDVKEANEVRRLWVKYNSG